MTEVSRILDQLKRAFEGEAWHGPAVLEILNGTTAEQAAARPLDGAHTIGKRRFTFQPGCVRVVEDWMAIARN